MKIKNIPIYLTFSFMFGVFDANAVYLEITENKSMVGDWDYSGNPSVSGIYSYGSYVIDTNSFNIISENNFNGLFAETASAQLVFNGGGSNYLNVSNNVSADSSNGSGIFANISSSIEVNNMDIYANNNTNVGIGALDNSSIVLNGNGQNSIYVNNTDPTSTNAVGYGIASVSGSEVQINNMKTIEANNGSSVGFIANSGKITIDNSSGLSGNVFANNNGFAGFYSTGADAELNIKNMNIEANNNERYGFSAENGGKINVEGNGSNWLVANNNKDAGVVRGCGVCAETGAKITIENMNVETKENLHGIYIFSLSELDIIGNSSGSNKIVSSGNYNIGRTNGAGIFANDQSSIFIKDMNIETNDNVYGIIAYLGSVINIEGNGSNYIQANDNVNSSNGAGYGIYANNSGSEINIKNMNIEANNNGLYGISARDGGVVNITGNGSQWLVANNNYNTISTARGIFAEHDSKIDITNMNVETNSNKRHGIYASNGTIKIEGNGLNILRANYNGYNNDNNEGRGFSASGNTGLLEIIGMEIEVSGNRSNGALANTGAIVNITGKGAGNNLVVQENGVNGISAADAGSSVNITNMNIYSNKNGSHGVYTENGGKIDVVGNGSNFLIAKSNGERQIQADGSGSEINISNMNVDVEGVGVRASIYAMNGSTINITSTNNNFLRSSNGAHGYAAEVAGSVLNIRGMNVISSQNSSSDFVSRNGGEINIYDSNVSMYSNYGLLIDYVGFTNVYNSVLNAFGDWAVLYTYGGGTAYFDNSTVSALNGLANINSGVGELEAINSNLSGLISTVSGSTSNVKMTNTTWANVGKSNITNYVASGVDAFMNVFFGAMGGGDLLTIEDTSSGDTTLHVNSIGTDGTQSEVMVVDQTSASSAAATFSLYGNVVDSGAFEYALYQGSADGNAANVNNYYLRSTGVMTNTAKTVANIPAIHVHIIKTGMNQLNKRMGELRDNDPYKTQGLWVRSFAKHLKVDESIDSHLNIYGMEAGYDQLVYSDCDDKIFAGVMAGYMYTDDIKTRNTRAANGSGHANTPSIGAYGTWVNYNGWFADATLRSFWSDMSMTAYTSQNLPMSFDADRQFTTASLEFGRQMFFDIDEYSKYVFEPKVEFSYAYAKSKSFNTKTAFLGNKIHYGSTDSIQGRLGVLTGYNTELEDGTVLQPFVQLSLIQEWGGVTDIRYGGAGYKSDVSGTSVEFSGGLNSKINDNWSAYGEVAYETGSVIDALSANIGVRFNF